MDDSHTGSLAQDARPAVGWERMLGLLLAVMTQVVLVLSLISRVLHPWVNSDHLYPHAFARDLLYGTASVGDWKFGTAPFFLPDYGLFLPLVALTGTNGWSYTLYALIQFAALSLAVGWLLFEVFPGQGKARPLTVAFWGMNGLLLAQWISTHALGLWWLALPGFHGGALLGGLLWVAWQLRLFRQEVMIDRKRVVIGALVITLVTFSNVLFFFYFVLPWALVLMARYWKNPLERARLRATGWMVAWGLGGFLALKLASALTGYFAFARHFRYFPSPAHLAETATALMETFRRPIWELAGLVLLASLGTVVWLLVAGRRLRMKRPRILAEWLLVQTAIVCALPIASGYWKDAMSARYWLPLWLLPVVGVGLMLMTRFTASRRSLHWLAPVGALVLIVVVGFQLPWENPRRWAFPSADRVETLDTLARDRGWTRGLAEYWNFHYANELAGADAPWRVLPVEPDGQPYFWCVNVAWYLEADRESWPRYDFVIIDGLDPAEIESAYGSPGAVLQAGEWTVWEYREGSQDGLRTVMETPVREFLGL